MAYHIDWRKEQSFFTYYTGVTKDADNYLIFIEGFWIGNRWHCDIASRKPLVPSELLMAIGDYLQAIQLGIVTYNLVKVQQEELVG